MTTRTRSRAKAAEPKPPKKPRPTEAVKRLVWTRSGGMCAFPECHRVLVEEAANGDPAVFVGEIAHIVGHSEDGGPRADQPIPGDDREGEANLVLLCLEHHTVIDGQTATYTVERLVALKAAHEAWVRDALRVKSAAPAPPLVSETVHSTLLVVEQLPKYVYTAPVDILEKDLRGWIRYPHDKSVLVPAIVREKKLVAFADLGDAHGPFADVVREPGAAERHELAAWLKDEDLGRWVVDLLNRALGRFMAARGLRYDREHRRYFFPPETDAAGKPAERKVSYRPMNQPLSERKVAWNPVRKSTGEAKRYWTHLAVGLRFHRVSPGAWVLSLRPEHRFTQDGETPIAPKSTGKRSTSTKSRMYNVDLLHEVHFWRDYLSGSQPRTILQFGGGQSLILDGMLMQADLRWPGVAGDAVAFQNAEVEDDLFTSAAFHRALAEGGSPDSLQQDVELDLHELQDLDDLDDLSALEEAAGDDALSDDDLADTLAVAGADDGSGEESGDDA